MSDAPRTVAAVVAAVALLLPLPAGAEVQVEVLRPADGAVVSRAQEPWLVAEGTFTPAAPVQATRTFYLRRDECRPEHEPYMSLRHGSGEWPCGDFYAGTPNEVFLLLSQDEGWRSFRRSSGCRLCSTPARR